MPKLINRAQVLERLGNRSISWLYEEMGAGRLPRPVKLGRSGVAWVESEIDDYIAQRIADGRVTLTPRVRKPKSEPTPAAA
jgi:prophage regulatory protein